jgi:hypothetical protein
VLLVVVAENHVALLSGATTVAQVTTLVMYIYVMMHITTVLVITVLTVALQDVQVYYGHNALVLVAIGNMEYNSQAA